MDTLAPNAEFPNLDATLFRLVDANIIGVATCDTDGRILAANDAYLDMLGYTRDEFASGQIHWRDLTPHEWHDVSARAAAELKATGRCQSFEKEYFRKDGSRVPVLMASAAIDESQRQIVAFVLDLTARKNAESALTRSETYLAEAQRLTHTGSWAATPGGGRPTHWSDETFRIFERAHADGPLDDVGLLQAMHPADRDACGAVIAAAVRAHIDFAVDFRIVLPNGTVKHLHKIGHPVRDDAREIAEWVGTIVDVTDRKTADEERERVRQLESEREAAIVNERTRLAGEIHDTLAQGLAMIVMQLADAEAKLGTAWSRAEKPLSLAREFAVESLAYARRSLNTLRPNAGRGALTRSLREVVDSLARPFAGAIVLRITGEDALFDAGVEAALTGIAREAITNAVKHSHANSIAVEVEFADGGAVRVVVSDDGIGFDPNAVRAGAYGLVGMQERAARAQVALTFVTEPEGGTTIVSNWSSESARLTVNGTLAESRR
jgi:PAS domain S-box-containing protein